MPLLQILQVPHPMLKRVAAPVERVTDEIRRLMDDMLATMYAAPGIGLAAIQVGVPQRVLVIDLQEPGEDGEPVRSPRVFANPEIVEASADMAVYNEGCLSVPDMYADVDRPARIRARWQDAEGARHEAELDGLLATCLQHEIDHLNGIVFLDHLSRLKREMLLKKLAKARREKVAA